MFQVAPNCAVDFHFQPLTHFGVHFPSDFGDDALLKAHGRHAMMHRYAAENALGACLKPILTMCERKTVMSLAGLTKVQVPLDGGRWLSSFLASLRNRSVDTSSDSAKMAIRAGFSPLVYQGPCRSRFAYSEAPSGGSRWERKPAARAAGRSGLAAVGAE